eukprot:m.125325 g.125325  ORF g.125325 m.125325 type:complete len:640 (+) comp11163_c0_seq3:231-2150(+)
MSRHVHHRNAGTSLVGILAPYPPPKTAAPPPPPPLKPHIKSRASQPPQPAGRVALLSGISQGVKLKKTTTVDKSVPHIPRNRSNGGGSGSNGPKTLASKPTPGDGAGGGGGGGGGAPPGPHASPLKGNHDDLRSAILSRRASLVGTKGRRPRSDGAVLTNPPPPPPQQQQQPAPVTTVSRSFRTASGDTSPSAVKTVGATLRTPPNNASTGDININGRGRNNTATLKPVEDAPGTPPHSAPTTIQWPPPPATPPATPVKKPPPPAVRPKTKVPPAVPSDDAPTTTTTKVQRSVSLDSDVNRAAAPPPTTPKKAKLSLPGPPRPATTNAVTKTPPPVTPKSNPKSVSNDTPPPPAAAAAAAPTASTAPTPIPTADGKTLPMGAPPVPPQTGKPTRRKSQLTSPRASTDGAVSANTPTSSPLKTTQFSTPGTQGKVVSAMRRLNLEPVTTTPSQTGPSTESQPGALQPPALPAPPPPAAVVAMHPNQAPLDAEDDDLDAAERQELKPVPIPVVPPTPHAHHARPPTPTSEPQLVHNSSTSRRRSSLASTHSVADVVVRSSSHEPMGTVYDEREDLEKKLAQLQADLAAQMERKARIAQTLEQLRTENEEGFELEANIAQLCSALGRVAVLVNELPADGLYQ